MLDCFVWGCAENTILEVDEGHYNGNENDHSGVVPSSLGQKDKQIDLVSPTLNPHFSENHNNGGVEHVACGYKHTLYVLKDGTVYASGCNRYGQCCCNNDYDAKLESHKKHDDAAQPRIDRQCRPTEVIFPARSELVSPFTAKAKETIDHVAVTHASSFALTSEGQVYSWGGSTFGVLGRRIEVNEDDERKKCPQKIDFPFGGNTKVAHISAGYHHCLALTTEGNVFGWGNNEWGQLGIFSNEDKQADCISEPAKVQFGPCVDLVVKTISCGAFHSLAMVQVSGGGDSSQKQTSEVAFSWGCAKDGRLGFKTQKKMHRVPEEIKSLSTLMARKGLTLLDVKAGGAHSLALASKRGIRLTLTPEECANCVSGTHDTSHDKIIGSSGRVIAWGSGTYGQLGHGHVWGQEDPIIVEGIEDAIQIAAGSRHSLAIVKRLSRGVDRELWCWGYNSCGELGLGDKNLRLQPYKVHEMKGRDVVRVYAGHNYSFCLTKESVEGDQCGGKAAQGKHKTVSGKTSMCHLIHYWKAQAGVVSLGSQTSDKKQYCLDSIEMGQDDLEIISEIRGTYETYYTCVHCKLSHICMACARNCHSKHCVTAKFKPRDKERKTDCKCCCSPS